MTESEEHQHAYNEDRFQEEPSERRLVLNIIGWAGVILIFVVILYVAYVPNRTGPLVTQVQDRRTEIFDEVTLHASSRINAYFRSPDGSVRIPIERAMQVVPDQLNAKPVRAVAAVQPQAEQAAPAADMAEESQAAAPADAEGASQPASPAPQSKSTPAQ